LKETYELRELAGTFPGIALVGLQSSRQAILYDSQHDGFWVAIAKGRIQGSIIIDGMDAQTKGAHLRWFIVSDAYRFQGTGSRLMNMAMDFCQSKQYDVVYLWTFEGINPARHLYEKAGFQLIDQYRGTQWGTEVNEQYFGQRFIATGAVTFNWACLPYRIKWRYGPNAYRTNLIDIGHVCQNLYLACEAIGGGTCAVAAYDQHAIDELVILNESKEQWPRINMPGMIMGRQGFCPEVHQLISNQTQGEDTHEQIIQVLTTFQGRCRLFAH
jgi:GNAT superfamily N-acetyltransferase